MNRTFIAAAAAAVAAAASALTLGIAGPASAASIAVADPADVSHGVDLRAVRVVNGDTSLRIVLTHADLRRTPMSGASGAVYIDTDPADRGPELVFVGGYFEGTDYRLLRTEGFGVKNWKGEVKGFYRLTLDYANEKAGMVISREVLGRVGKVRVAVRVAGENPDGTQVVDWFGESRSFTSWVHRG